MASEHAHAHHEEVTNTGISNRKLGFWIFLASECIFFACLLVGYLVYGGKSLIGPYPMDVFDIELTSISTFVLLMSSLFVALAVHSAHQGEGQKARKWILATIVGGLIFLGFQVYEFTHFYHMGLTLSGNLFGTTFYVLTGFHGAHVAVGIIWLSSLYLWDRKNGLGKDKAEAVEVGGLYWHFVDVVWIVIFTVVYLMEFVEHGVG